MRLQGTMTINSAGHLVIGGCDTVELAQEFGTPLLVIDEACLRERCRAFRKAFGEGAVIYAGKALLMQVICRIVAEEGLGLDVVSGGELYTALQAGFPPERLYFHGNNKTPEELDQALAAGVGRIVVDNFRELELLSALAGRNGHRPVKVLLRLTPGIEAHTHHYIRTGQIDSKFGFVLGNGQADEAVARVLACSALEMVGLHCHVGSQIFSLEPYAEAAAVMMDYAAQIHRRTGLAIRELDLGGGFGIYYTAGDEPRLPEEYARVIRKVVVEKAKAYGLPVPRILVEPGRAIIGPAGTTLYTVGSIKEIPGVRKYLAVDGGMADNIRPALYQARYEALLANKADQPVEERVSITGKCCESGDMLIWDIWLPRANPGDILAVSCTGAYCYPMASNYNRLPRPAVVLVGDGRAELIGRRETYADLLRLEVVPPRLQPSQAAG
ncbi:MAG: diaminopimelate decarboxylase [Moorellales bacterium]